jgi:nucleoside-diphosphate-sugar epimerase
VTILITGATGFVMANLARHLAELGHQVVAADLNPPDEALRTFLTGLPGPVIFRRLNVTDRAAVRAFVAETHPERTVHGAAITSIPPDVERARFVDTVEVNVVGTLVVLDALRDAGPGRTVVVSSGSVYGPRPDLAPIAEDDARNPQGVYPVTKWAAEALAVRFADINGLDLAVVRLASPFGPFERDTGSRPLLSPIREWAVAAVRGEVVRASGSATFMRDAIYAPDVASGIGAVLLAETLPHRIYNVGWGRGTTTAEALAALRRLVPGVKIDHDPQTPSAWASGERGPLDSTRLRRDLRWAPRYDLDSGLAAYLAWLREQP